MGGSSKSVLAPLPLRYCASPAAGKAFLDMLGVFAEFETNLRRECQMEGIAAAKLRGVYKGRPASIDAAKVAPSRPRAWAPPRSPSALAWGGRASIACWRREGRPLGGRPLAYAKALSLRVLR
jgi:hypothetical protein